MGAALMQSWAFGKINAQFLIVDPRHKPDFQNIDYAARIEDIHDALQRTNLVILAVKPQILSKVCETLKTHIPEDTAILSIAAGVSLKSLSQKLHNKQPIIRAMPNLPAAIGKGITAAITGPAISPQTKTLADTLLSCAGKVEWIEDESLFDAVTALSGSGPAYVFYLIEALTKAGETIGLPQKMATALARQTVIGAAALAENSPEPAETLRRNVTSPGGTTEAALERLMDGQMQNILNEALKAAKTRSEKLNS